MSLRDLGKYSGLFQGYTEIRVQENRNLLINCVKGSITANTRSKTSGVSARVNVGGSWGFSSNPEINDESVKKVLEAATENARFLSSKEKRAAVPLPSSPAQSDDDFSTKKPRLSQKDLLDLVRRIDGHISSKYPTLTSRNVSLSCLDMEKSLITSDGSHAHSMIPRAHIRVGLSVLKDGQPINVGDSFGGLGQVEDALPSEEELFQKIEILHEHLMKKAEGIFADAGTKTCVLDAELAGILAHEAIGHTTEADLVKGGSVAGPLLGKEAASPIVTLIDFANSALGKTCPVPVYIDDEGTKAKDAVIIENGILKGYMHNKESAALFGHEPTGNARAYSFSDEPIIRMRNTAILPGKDKLEDMISSVDDGYYLIRPSNGQADSTSEFMFGVILGYEIKQGKLGRAIRDTTISGVAFDLLKTVTMVSSDMKWLSAGMCGKKQMIPVGMGGPAIKCRVSIGGR